MQNSTRSGAVRALVAAMTAQTRQTILDNPDFIPQLGTLDICRSPAVRKFPDTESFIKQRMPVYIEKLLECLDETRARCLGMIANDSAGDAWNDTHRASPSDTLDVEFEKIRRHIQQLGQRAGIYMSSSPPLVQPDGNLAVPQLPSDTGTFIEGPLKRAATQIVYELQTLENFASSLAVSAEVYANAVAQRRIEALANVVGHPNIADTVNDMADWRQTGSIFSRILFLKGGGPDDVAILSVFFHENRSEIRQIGLREIERSSDLETLPSDMEPDEEPAPI